MKFHINCINPAILYKMAGLLYEICICPIYSRLVLLPCHYKHSFSWLQYRYVCLHQNSSNMHNQYRSEPSHLSSNILHQY